MIGPHYIMLGLNLQLLLPLHKTPPHNQKHDDFVVVQVYMQSHLLMLFVSKSLKALQGSSPYLQNTDIILEINHFS
jgi:hypothetical protein